MDNNNSPELEQIYKDLAETEAKLATTHNYFGMIEVIAALETLSKARKQAVTNLAKLRTREAIKELMTIAINDTDYDVRDEASKALVNMNDPQLNKFFVDKLLDLLAIQPNCYVIQALGHFADRRAVLPICEYLRVGYCPRHAINALLQLKDERCVEASIAAFKVNDRDVHAGLIALLGLFKERSIPLLVKELASEDGEMRWRVAVALGVMGDARALPGLEWMQLNDNTRTWWGASAKIIATDAIGRIKERSQ